MFYAANAPQTVNKGGGETGPKAEVQNPARATPRRGQKRAADRRLHQSQTMEILWQIHPSPTPLANQGGNSV